MLLEKEFFTTSGEEKSLELINRAKYENAIRTESHYFKIIRSEDVFLIYESYSPLHQEMLLEYGEDENIMFTIGDRKHTEDVINNIMTQNNKNNAKKFLNIVFNEEKINRDIKYKKTNNVIHNIFYAYSGLMDIKDIDFNNIFKLPYASIIINHPKYYSTIKDELLKKDEISFMEELFDRVENEKEKNDLFKIIKKSGGFNDKYKQKINHNNFNSRIFTQDLWREVVLNEKDLEQKESLLFLYSNGVNETRKRKIKNKIKLDKNRKKSSFYLSELLKKENNIVFLKTIEKHRLARVVLTDIEFFDNINSSMLKKIIKFYEKEKFYSCLINQSYKKELFEKVEEFERKNKVA